MNLIAKRIIYHGSFEPIDGWYIGMDDRDNSVKALHNAMVEQNIWSLDFQSKKINLYDEIIINLNGRFMYGIFWFNNFEDAKRAAEWVNSMLVMDRML